MRTLFYSFLGYFLTIPGVMVMAALDSSMVFFLPLGIDFVVIIMTARSPEPVLALHASGDGRVDLLISTGSETEAQQRRDTSVRREQRRVLDERDPRGRLLGLRDQFIRKADGFRPCFPGFTR